MTLDEQISEYDFSAVRPSEHEFRDFLTEISETPTVTDTQLYLSESEVRLVISLAESDSLDFLADLPDGVQIRDATITNHNTPTEVEVLLSFYDWFGIEDMITVPEDSITPLENEEVTAFVLAHLQYLSEIESATAVQKDGSYNIHINLNPSISTTHLFEEFIEIFGVRFEAITVIDSGISEVELDVPEDGNCDCSSCDAFRMTQLKHHERLALESYQTSLPCGHTGRVQSELVAKPNTNALASEFETISIDGFECAEIQLQEDGTHLPRVETADTNIEYDESTEFVPIESLFGFLCEECRTLYHFLDVDQVKNTVLEHPRPQRESIEMPTGHTYQFAIFPVTPKPIDILSNSDIVGIFER